VVDGVVDDVLERVLVLLLGLDHPGVEPASEDVVAPVVALVEGPGVATVQVADPLGEIGLRCLDDQVVVVAHQAADVGPPAVAALDPAQDSEEDGAVAVLEEDRREVVPARGDVVLRPGGEVAAWTTHPSRR
jgi:hypothetical protein